MKTVWTISIFVLLLGGLTYHYRDSLVFRDSPRAEGRGVVIHDRLRSFSEGYLLLSIFNEDREGIHYCAIIDRSGRELFKLFGAICTPMADGGYASNMGGVSRFDRQGRLVWHSKRLLHHDLFEVPGSGEVFFWSSRFYEDKRKGPFRADVLVGIDRGGREIFLWDGDQNLPELEKMFGIPPKPIYQKRRRASEYTHFNSIQVLPENSVANVLPAFAKGNLLVSEPYSASAAIIDRTSGKVIWTYRPPQAELFSEIHSTRLLPEGTILLYYNNHLADAEPAKRFSEVLEIDPVERRIVWSYRAKTPGKFYAKNTGAAFRLGNGNTLVTHLVNGGGVFEVTPEGRIVWEWNNGETQSVYSGIVYRAIWVPADWAEYLQLRRGPEAGLADP